MSPRASESRVWGEHKLPTCAGAVRRGRERQGSPITLNLAPMIDVTFLLLIFFLVTTTFGRPEGILASDLPRDQGAVSVSLPLSPIVIRVRQEGPGAEDYLIHIDHFNLLPRDFTELADVLRAIQQEPGFDEQTPVVIVPDGAVAWDHVVNAWNAALRAGARTVVFGSK